MYKFLRFSGWTLGCTPTAFTKGGCYIQGTFLKDVPELSVYLMSKFLELEGQFHTSVSLASINQQTLCRVSNDERFQVIHKTLTNYDKIMNSVLYEILSVYAYRSKTPTITRTVSVSLGQTLASTVKTSATLKSVRTSPNLIQRNVNRQKPISVSVKLINPSKSVKNFVRNASTKSNRCKTPLLGRLESYDQVMKRLKK